MFVTKVTLFAKASLAITSAKQVVLVSKSIALQVERIVFTIPKQLVLVFKEPSLLSYKLLRYSSYDTYSP